MKEDFEVTRAFEPDPDFTEVEVEEPRMYRCVYCGRQSTNPGDLCLYDEVT